MAYGRYSMGGRDRKKIGGISRSVVDWQHDRKIRHKPPEQAEGTIITMAQAGNERPTIAQQYEASIMDAARSVRKFIPDKVNEYDRDAKKSTGRVIESDRMTLGNKSRQVGRNTLGVVIGHVVIGGETFAVEQLSKVVLRRAKSAPADTSDKSYAVEL